MRGLVYVSFLIVACSATKPNEPVAVQPEPATPVASAAPSAPPQSSVDVADAGSDAAAESEAALKAYTPQHKNAGESDTACPDGMKLVDGEYCTDVDHVCKKSWFDKSNKKTVCEEFEPKSTCVGQKVKKRFCIDTYTWPNEKGA